MTKFLTATALVLLLTPSAEAAPRDTCMFLNAIFAKCERGGGFERQRSERSRPDKPSGENPGGGDPTPDPTPDPDPEPETPKGDNGNHYGNDKPDNNDRDDKNKHDGEQTKGDHHDNNGGGKPDDKPGKGNGKK